MQSFNGFNLEASKEFSKTFDGTKEKNWGCPDTGHRGIHF
jgi:hypothetical protein